MWSITICVCSPSAPSFSPHHRLQQSRNLTQQKNTHLNLSSPPFSSHTPMGKVLYHESDTTHFKKPAELFPSPDGQTGNSEWLFGSGGGHLHASQVAPVGFQFCQGFDGLPIDCFGQITVALFFFNVPHGKAFDLFQYILPYYCNPVNWTKFVFCCIK